LRLARKILVAIRFLCRMQASWGAYKLAARLARGPSVCNASNARKQAMPGSKRTRTSSCMPYDPGEELPASFMDELRAMLPRLGVEEHRVVASALERALPGQFLRIPVAGFGHWRDMGPLAEPCDEYVCHGVPFSRVGAIVEHGFMRTLGSGFDKYRRENPEQNARTMLGGVYTAQFRTALWYPGSLVNKRADKQTLLVGEAGTTDALWPLRVVLECAVLEAPFLKLKRAKGATQKVYDPTALRIQNIILVKAHMSPLTQEARMEAASSARKELMGEYHKKQEACLAKKPEDPLHEAILRLRCKRIKRQRNYNARRQRIGEGMLQWIEGYGVTTTSATSQASASPTPKALENAASEPSYPRFVAEEVDWD